MEENLAILGEIWLDSQETMHVTDNSRLWSLNVMIRLITAHLLLQVNCDKIMHTYWDFDASNVQTRNPIEQASKLKGKCIFLS